MSTETEMVERVARALADSQGMGEFPGLEMYRVMARAAIEAMREPTEAMLEVGFGGATGVKRKLWQLMIDDALNPHPETAPK